MSLKALLLGLILCCFVPVSFACDSCSGGLSLNTGTGLLTAYRNNSIGLNWHYNQFVSAPNHGIGSEDYFHTSTLSLRYHIKNRWKVLVFQPYRVNIRQELDNRSQLEGFGDTQLLANYTLVPNTVFKENYKIFLEIGAGVKLPLGQYDPDIHQQNLPENFNIGNGSWGNMFMMNTVLSRKSLGWVTNIAHVYHHKSTSDYQFGHQTSIQSSFFLEKKIKEKYRIIPSMGAQIESIAKDQFANGNTVDASGGTGYFGTLGCSFRYENWMIGVNYVEPLSTNYANEEVLAKARISVQLNYIF